MSVWRAIIVILCINASVAVGTLLILKGLRDEALQDPWMKFGLTCEAIALMAAFLIIAVLVIP